MTQEEKAKAYDAVLEQAKRELNTCGSLDCDAARQIFRFFPQLRESNDERIRKYLIEELKATKSVGELKFIIPHPTREECIAYLEKQKEGEKEVSDLFDSTDSYNKGFRSGREKALQELKEHIKEDKTQCYAYDAGYAAGFIVGKEQGWKEHKAFVKESSKTADSIPSDCASDAKCEDRSPKHSDSDGIDIRDTPAYWRGWDDAMKQKEQKHPDGCFTCDEYKKGYEEGRRNGFTAGYNKAIKEVEQKEQKPVERYLDLTELLVPQRNIGQKLVTDGWPIKDANFHSNLLYLMRENNSKEGWEGCYEWLEELPSRISLKQKPAEWSEEDREMIQSIITNGCVDDKQERWLRMLPERICQPKQEWSEEDDQLIGFIFDLLNSLVWRKEWAMDKKECLERLKSLRPSWKPSEWQMSMLLAVINDPNNAGSESCYLTLKSIYEQLKKL